MREQFPTVNVVYDSVGHTRAHSLAVVRDGGQLVFYGMSGVATAPVDPSNRMYGSKILTGGDLWSFLTSCTERLRRSAELSD